MRAEHATGKAFRHLELLLDVVDAGMAAGEAQKFPEAASRMISFSSVRSETDKAKKLRIPVWRFGGA